MKWCSKKNAGADYILARAAKTHTEMTTAAAAENITRVLSKY